jgi:hypothetical protein
VESIIASSCIQDNKNPSTEFAIPTPPAGSECKDQQLDKNGQRHSLLKITTAKSVQKPEDLIFLKLTKS